MDRSTFESDDGFQEEYQGGQIYNVAQRKNRYQLPGYSGHIHNQRETFGTTFANATRVALQCPPDSPEPATHWKMQQGTRNMTTLNHSLPGTGFDGMAKPSEASRGTRVYVQGSSVDLMEYYKTLEEHDYEQVLIKSGTAKKARSFVNLGDNFYFSGQHMWETTYQESFNEEERIAAVQSETGASDKDAGPDSAYQNVGQADEDEVDVEEATFRYRVIQAVVGKKRLDELEEQIRNKVMSRMAGGAGELLKCFKLFSSGKGEIGPTQLMSVVQDLGVDISRREAYALFGRFDINKDGGIVYYEFVDALLQKGETEGRDMSYYERR